MRKIVLLLFFITAGHSLFAQVTLSGRVTGAAGEPLPGASVVLEGTLYGVSTGSDGSYRFTRLKPGDYTLEVSFIGYQPVRKTVSLSSDTVADLSLEPENIFTEEVVVQATRATDKTPMAHTDITTASLRNRNMGQDLPFLLALTPSFVATSDAGTGIGYTSFRVRGTDMNRINVTVNGIPLNDAESHSTFFVDQPDLASSARNIQVQRGAGTTSGGGASFGAAINLQTLTLNKDPYAEISSSAGSFGTFKNSFAAGTGLIGGNRETSLITGKEGSGLIGGNRETGPSGETSGTTAWVTPQREDHTGGKFSFDARLTSIRSDGFIDRASSNLGSWFVSGGYYSPSTVVKAILFSGTEETYQAWNGVPSVRLRDDRQGMLRYGEHGLYSEQETREMLASGSRTYNLYTYKDQVDHYRQDHLQLHFSHRFSSRLNLSAALHQTLGEGYYEQFKAAQKFTSYGLPRPVVNGTEISRTDLVRRKWLDNEFYGMVFSLNYRKGGTTLTWGSGANNYYGRHFGRIIWGEFLPGLEPDHEFYRNRGRKSDLNSYLKTTVELAPRLSGFADLQLRALRYEIDGTDDDLRSLDLLKHYTFFNPKTGLYYALSPAQQLFVSFARTNREPNRDNFVDTPPGSPLPQHETLNDMEAGWSFRSASFTAATHLYYMFYHNQLALTGLINDVGAPVMVNVAKSHRAGVELSAGISISPALTWDGQLTLSSNKIKDFTEFVDDWDHGGQQAFTLGTTDLAFSPTATANSRLAWSPGKFAFSLLSFYVGKQYTDNTSSPDRVIDPYFVNHFTAEYSPRIRGVKKLTAKLLVNNLFNAEYETNAWVYSYLLDGERYTMDGYFPQAGRHFMAGIDISF
jgi:iron complex outermembrane receptor protein